jgi:hypothetical protein
MTKLWTVRAGICLCAALLLTFGAVAQQQADNSGAGNEEVGAGIPVVANPPAPATRIEAVALRKGAIILRGYSDVGAVQGDSCSLFVRAVEMSDKSKDEKRYGLELSVVTQTRTVLSYLDDEDIDALSDAIESLRKLDNTTTALMSFDATYRTRGDLQVTSFVPSSGGRMIALRAVQTLRPSGQLVWATAYFPLSQLQNIQQQLAAGKQALDRAKTAAATGAASK